MLDPARWVTTTWVQYRENIGSQSEGFYHAPDQRLEVWSGKKMVLMLEKGPLYLGLYVQAQLAFTLKSKVKFRFESGEVRKFGDVTYQPGTAKNDAVIRDMWGALEIGKSFIEDVMGNLPKNDYNKLKNQIIEVESENSEKATSFWSNDSQMDYCPDLAEAQKQVSHYAFHSPDITFDQFVSDIICRLKVKG